MTMLAVVSRVSSPASEQAARSKQQHAGHQDVDRHRGERRADRSRRRRRQHQAEQRRQQEAAERVCEANQNGPDQRPLDRTDAPDDDDDESEDQHRLAHADLHRLDGADHRARKAGQRRAEREDQRVEAGNVDAESADHLAIVLACTNANSDARVRNHRKQPGGDCKPDDDDGETIKRIGNAERQRHRAAKPGRNLQVQRQRTEQVARAFREDQDKRERRQHLVEMVAIVEPPDHGHLDDRADQRCGRKACRKGGEERARCRGDRRSGERPDHVERSMGKVDQPHDAEDQRQASRHQEQHDAELQAVQNLLDDQGKRHGAVPSGAVGAGARSAN